MAGFIDIVFSAPPGPGNDCLFIEVEDERGAAMKFGEWTERPDGNWALRVTSEEMERIYLAT